MKPNVIALTVDAGQFPPAAFLADKLAAINPRDDTAIVLFSDSADDLATAREFGVPAELVHLSFSTELPPVEKRLSGATFMRLFVPEVLGDDVDRILYLDVDIYPDNDSFFRLFDLNMNGHPVAAVSDLTVVCTQPEKLKAAGVSAAQYFNAGVMLIDRRRYLDADLRHRIVDLSMRSGLSQDAINGVIAGDWLELSPAMNMGIHVWNTFVRKVVAPSLLHFQGVTKPWHGPRFVLDHPVRPEIEKYLRGSPWKGYLAQYFSFQDAWNALQPRGRPVSAAPVKPDRFALPRESRAILAAYLRETAFADVSEGITRLDLSAIPPVVSPESADPPQPAERI